MLASRDNQSSTSVGNVIGATTAGSIDWSGVFADAVSFVKIIQISTSALDVDAVEGPSRSRSRAASGWWGSGGVSHCTAGPADAEPSACLAGRL